MDNGNGGKSKREPTPLLHELLWWFVRSVTPYEREVWVERVRESIRFEEEHPLTGGPTNMEATLRAFEAALSTGIGAPLREELYTPTAEPPNAPEEGSQEHTEEPTGESYPLRVHISVWVDVPGRLEPGTMLLSFMADELIASMGEEVRRNGFTILEVRPKDGAPVPPLLLGHPQPTEPPDPDPAARALHDDGYPAEEAGG